MDAGRVKSQHKENVKPARLNMNSGVELNRPSAETEISLDGSGVCANLKHLPGSRYIEHILCRNIQGSTASFHFCYLKHCVLLLSGRSGTFINTLDLWNRPLFTGRTLTSHNHLLEIHHVTLPSNSQANS